MDRIRLVLCDMDGTLLPTGAGTVSARTLAAIAEVQAAGIEFGPSSGRELSDLVRFFRGERSFARTGIMASGKQIYLDGKMVYRRPLPRDQVELLADCVSREHGVILNIYRPLDEQGRGETGIVAYGVGDGERELMAPLVEGPIVDELPAGDITTAAVVFSLQEREAADVYEAISTACSGLDFPMPVSFVFDVLEKGWSKVSALPILLGHLGLWPEELAYFGDSENDLTMLEALPNTFCMGNGTPEAKAASRWVIDTCENDGVAQVLESLARRGGELVEEDWL